MVNRSADYVNLFVHTAQLTDDQIKQYLAIVSDEMSTITEENEIRYNIHLIPSNLWEQLSEASKLRIENRVIRSVKEGELIGNTCRHGTLATWARRHFQFFTLKEQLNMTFIEKLESEFIYNRHYVVEYFLPQLPIVVLNLSHLRRCVKAISESIRDGDKFTRDALLKDIVSLPENWQKEFVKALKDVTDDNNPAIYLPDGTAFLRANEPGVSGDDNEIPF